MIIVTNHLRLLENQMKLSLNTTVVDDKTGLEGRCIGPFTRKGEQWWIVLWENKDTTAEKEKELLDNLNAMSEEADISRTRKAAVTRSSDARKSEGVSLMTEEGPKRVGSKPKLKDSDMLIGNTDNGITKDGEIVGNPTDNQIQAVVRNMEARERLSKDAKENLVKLKQLSQTQKQDKAINIMERNMIDTGPDQTGGIMGRP